MPNRPSPVLPPTTAFCLRGEVDGTDRTFALGPGEHLVGTGATAGIRLGVPGVSRRHTLIVVGDARVRISDLGSKNGTRVAGRPIASGSAGVEAEAGDEVRFGPVKLRLQPMSLHDTVLGLEFDPLASRSHAGYSETSLLGPETDDPSAYTWSR